MPPKLKLPGNHRGGLLRHQLVGGREVARGGYPGRSWLLSEDERVTRDFLLKERPDVVVNVSDVPNTVNNIRHIFYSTIGIVFQLA